MVGGCWVFFIFLALELKHNYGEVAHSSCKLPKDWLGSWFQSGQHGLIEINENSVGSLGTCHRISDGKYIFHREPDNCYQCVVFFKRHDNALEFKPGECRSSATQEGLCDISPDTSLVTLVKMDGKPILCPFNNPAAFSYNKGTGICSSPMSSLGKCLNESQVKLTFQACPDIPQTESKDETLTCLAEWKDDRDPGQTFLVGTMDTRYRRTIEQRLRCFLLRKTSNGLLMAQSSDATCHGGLRSPTEGFQTYNFSPGKKDKGMTFPNWSQDFQKMFSFDFKKLFTFNEDHSVLSVSNFSYTTGSSTLLSNMSVVETLEVDNNYVKMITRTLTGCEQIYNCALLFKRTENILELVEGLNTRIRLAACTEPNFVPSGRTNRHSLLLKENLEMEECSLNGVHNVTGLSLGSKTLQWLCEDKGFTKLEIGCSSTPRELRFVRECSERKVATYFCQGGWEETLNVSDLLLPNRDPSVRYRNNLLSRAQYKLPLPDIEDVSSETITRGFIIAKPIRRDSKSNKRVCLIYTADNGTYGWTVEKSGCERMLVPGLAGEHRFNTTFTGTCRGCQQETMNSLLFTFVAFVIFMTN